MIDTNKMRIFFIVFLLIFSYCILNAKVKILEKSASRKPDWIKEIPNGIEYDYFSGMGVSSKSYKEAKNIGIIHPKINIIGPLTFLGLSKSVDNTNTYKYFDNIRRYLYYRSNDTELSTDIAQEVFIKFWKKDFKYNKKTKSFCRL